VKSLNFLAQYDSNFNDSRETVTLPIQFTALSKTVEISEAVLG